MSIIQPRRSRARVWFWSGWGQGWHAGYAAGKAAAEAAVARARRRRVAEDMAAIDALGRKP